MGKHELAWEELKAKCREENLPATTEEILPCEGILGQDRAARAIEFGLKMRNPGYNIYVAGGSGTGRTTSVEIAVRKMAENLPTPDDWCYVYNFIHPDKPDALRFPPGKAVEFGVDMEKLVEELKVEVPRSFESKLYEEHRNQSLKEFQRKKEEMFATVEESARQAGFVIKQTPSGIIFIPTVEGKQLTEEDLDKLTDEAKKDIRGKQEVLYETMAEVLRRMRDEEKRVKQVLENLERETGLYTIKPRIDELKEKYQSFAEVVQYLEAVQKDILQNLQDFQERKEPELLPGLRMPNSRESALGKYQVNVFVDNSRTKGAPVVTEMNPTSYNLSGRIEYRPQLGAMVTDYTMMKAGALHNANGGFLILQVLDVLRNYFAWEVLKRALRNKEIGIEDLNEQFRLINTPSLKAEPIPLNIKVVLIGSPMLYYLLYSYDEDFRRLFKIRADFSGLMDRDKAGTDNYLSIISKICRDEKLKPLDKSALREVMQYGSRAVSDQRKLTTRFTDVADLIREANYWADEDKADRVGEAHVKKALDEKVYRSNLIEKRLEELIREGTIMVDIEGAVTGQINGLAVMMLGDYSFGKPSRITARVYTGKAGVINIDREVKLSGTIHNKGFMILNGYLGAKYGADRPLSFSASLCFEQLYEEIEGDSASSAELYALISAIAELPIKQSIAVTGSVNQNGEVQPIGGVNEKIEGFYYTCKSRRLTGDQGVIIPVQNVPHLMLNDEVIEAVRNGRFRIWAVRTIEQGIEILTGIPAGERQKDGSYPAGSVNALVCARLVKLMEDFRKHDKGKPDHPGKKKAKKKTKKKT